MPEAPLKNTHEAPSFIRPGTPGWKLEPERAMFEEPTESASDVEPAASLQRHWCVIVPIACWAAWSEATGANAAGRYCESWALYGVPPLETYV
jgi:hypothetical protein